jgi:hypothetical protein
MAVLRFFIGTRFSPTGENLVPGKRWSALASRRRPLRACAKSSARVPCKAPVTSLPIEIAAYWCDATSGGLLCMPPGSTSLSPSRINSLPLWVSIPPTICCSRPGCACCTRWSKRSCAASRLRCSKRSRTNSYSKPGCHIILFPSVDRSLGDRVDEL